MARHRKNPKVDIKSSPQIGSIERFFASYSGFQWDPSEPSGSEFQRLRKSYRWRRDDNEGDIAWTGFRVALIKEFNRLFGTDADDLLAWQNLCTFVGIRERFESRGDCIKVRFLIPVAQINVTYHLDRVSKIASLIW